MAFFRIARVTIDHPKANHASDMDFTLCVDATEEVQGRELDCEVIWATGDEKSDQRLADFTVGPLSSGKQQFRLTQVPPPNLALLPIDWQLDTAILFIKIRMNERLVTLIMCCWVTHTRRSSSASATMSLFHWQTTLQSSSSTRNGSRKCSQKARESLLPALNSPKMFVPK